MAKVFGSFSRLVSLLFRKDGQDVTLRPNQSTTYTAARDVQLPPGDAAHVIVSADSSQTLTNKTISGASNTLSNIPTTAIASGALPAGVTVSSTNIVDGTIVDGDINASAAIALSKLATGALPTGITVASANIVDGTIVNADINASANIDANKIGTGVVSTTEFNYLDGVTSAIQTQLDNKQPLDSDLTAVAGLSTTGLIARTGAGTAATRTVTAGSSKVSISNGDGVSGNPSIDVTEANLTLNNIGGTLGTSKGGTGLTAIGSALQVLRVNAGGTALEYASAGGDITNGGNTTGANITIGTNDNFALQFETNSSVKGSVDTTGAWTLGTTSGGGVTHTVQSGGVTGLTIAAGAGNNLAQLNLTPTGTGNAEIVNRTTGRQTTFYSSVSTGGDTIAGFYSSTGAWTLGPVAAIGGTGFAGTNIVGRTNNTAVPTGYVGQLISANPGAGVTPAASGSYVNVTSVSLTAGVWAVSGTAFYVVGTATGVTEYITGISLSSAALDVSNENNFAQINPQTSSAAVPTGTRILVVSTTIPVYLVGRVTYTTVGSSGWGVQSRLNAVRIA